jgi:hypothetical protein
MKGGPAMRSANIRYTINHNATNMSYVTNLNKRECDLENFGEKITKFGAVVGTIWLKQVMGVKL